MSYIDCHSHLSFLSDSDIKTLFSWGQGRSLQSWVLGGYNSQDWIRQKEIQKQWPDKVYTCLGLHPWEVIQKEEAYVQEQWKLLESEISQADFIGETGLDLFLERGKEKLSLQKEIFENHLQLKTDKPYVFHIVRAHGHALELLKSYPGRGFVHSFSGSVEVAMSYVDHGIGLSFSSSILSGKFVKAMESLKKVPLESLFLESDSPHSQEGALDPSPVDIYFKVAEEVAKLRGIGIDQLLHQVVENIKTLVK